MGVPMAIWLAVAVTAQYLGEAGVQQHEQSDLVLPGQGLQAFQCICWQTHADFACLVLLDLTSGEIQRQVMAAGQVIQLRLPVFQLGLERIGKGRLMLMPGDIGIAYRHVGQDRFNAFGAMTTKLAKFVEQYFQ